MLAELSRSELGLWTALWQLDPWGEQRADKRAAIGHALFANANRDSSKRPQPFSILDFMPYYERSPEETQIAVAESLFHTLTAAGGGRKGWDKSEWKRRRKEVGRKK